MAFADVFTAITVDCPYRKGMNPDSALAVLDSMAREGALDSRVIDVLRGITR